MARIITSIPENPIIEFHPDTIEVIRNIYSLDDDKLAQSVDILEEWAKKQSHFVNKHFGRVFYEKVLITCKGSVEKAKFQIDKFCTLKTLLPKFFVHSDEIRHIISNISDVAFAVPMPKMTEDYKRIFVVKLYNGEFSLTKFTNYCRVNLVIAEYLKAHDYVDGFVVVIDNRDVNLLELMPKINLIELQQFVTILVEGYGAKVKAIHILSESKVIDIFVKAMKSVLPPKIANRLYLHPKIDTLYEDVDRELLPAELGGNDKSLKELRAKLFEVICSDENLKRLEASFASRTDESRRQIEDFNNQCLGLPGSFRTLTVD